jgi:hypothetical protein
MDRIDIDTWATNSAEGWSSLLLGNGASIAIHKEFAYPTLHGIADAKGLLATTAPIFAKLGTTDFEHVRYGVSLTAAALRWTEIAPKRAVLVASRDDHMLWAKSNEAALRSGAYFATRKNTIELPRQALAHSYNGWDAGDQQTGRAQDWFPREPTSMPVTEMTRVAGQYDYTLTLLLMPDAEWQRPRHDDEEAEEDTFDRFIRNGQYPVR